MYRSQRLFVALFPVQVTRHRLLLQASGLAAETSGRVVPEANLHITLRYFGKVTSDVTDCIVQRLGQIRADTFTLRFSRLETRRRQGMIWAVPERCPEPLTALAAEIDQRSSGCGISPRDHEFLPHITLVRNIKRAPEPRQIEPIDIVVDNFELVDSETLPQGSRYTQLHRWALG